MIAKLIVYGEDRPAAIARLRAALEQQAVLGVQTNAPLLLAIATHAAFHEGQTYTNFLEAHALIGAQPSSQEAQQPDPHALYAAALLDLGEPLQHGAANSEPARVNNPWQTLDEWRILGAAHRTTSTHYGQSTHIEPATSPHLPGTSSLTDLGQPA